MATVELLNKSPDKSVPTPRPEVPLSRFSLDNAPGVDKIASLGLTLFLVGLFISTRWAPHFWVLSVLGSSACMAMGWAVGFLFGVPRVAANADSARINTNLEQISDWLTKILVGVGLTQIQSLPPTLHKIARFISNDYGTSGNDVFSLSMVLYFSTLGFLTGYLLTRLALQKAFDEQEERTQVNTTGPAEIKVSQPGPAASTTDNDFSDAVPAHATDQDSTAADPSDDTPIP